MFFVQLTNGKQIEIDKLPCVANEIISRIYRTNNCPLLYCVYNCCYMVSVRKHIHTLIFSHINAELSVLKWNLWSVSKCKKRLLFAFTNVLHYCMWVTDFSVIPNKYFISLLRKNKLSKFYFFVRSFFYILFINCSLFSVQKCQNCIFHNRQKARFQ